MTFLNASLLGWIVPLVGVPWLIHLLNKRFPKTFRFPTITHIKKSMAQRSRLFRLRHLALALVRSLAVALLVLMFLKPVREMFGSHAGRTGPRRVVLLFDHSLSMEARDHGVSAHKRGVIEAEKIINTLAPDDAVNVVAVERNPSPCYPDLTTNQGEVLGFLYHLTAGLGAADFNKAVAAAADMLGKEGAGRGEIYVISDFQRTGWSTVDLTKLPADVRVFFVNVASDARQNHAIIGARFEPGTAGGPARVEATVGNYADAPFEGKIEARVDGKTGFETTVAVAPWTTATVSLPVKLTGEGTHSLELRLPEGDDLPQDDHWFLTASVAEKETVLVVSDEAGGEKHAAFFLSTALDPYEGKGGAVRVRHLTSAQITGAELSTAKKMFLTSLDLLPEATCKLLAGFVHNGGSLLYFLDGKADAENLAALDKAGGDALAPLRLESKQSIDGGSAVSRQKARDTAAQNGQTVPGGVLQIMRGDFKSKYLRLFRGPHRGDLALMEFYDFYRATPTARGTTLLTYSDGSPAMAATGEGLGTLLACNFSVNELSSNMARQRAFPAWIQDLVKAVGSDDTDPEKGNEVGDTVQAEVWKTEMPGESVLSPSGQPVRTDRELDVNRYRLSFAAPEPGVYRLAGAGASYAWAVNCAPDESDLRAVDTDLLRRRVNGGTQAANFVEGQRDYELLNKGRPLFQYFALGLLVLLAVELGLFKLFQRLAA